MIRWNYIIIKSYHAPRTGRPECPPDRRRHCDLDWDRGLESGGNQHPALWTHDLCGLDGSKVGLAETEILILRSFGLHHMHQQGLTSQIICDPQRFLLDLQADRAKLGGRRHCLDPGRLRYQPILLGVMSLDSLNSVGASLWSQHQTIERKCIFDEDFSILK